MAHLQWFFICLLCPSLQAARILVYLPLSTWSHYMQYELLYETLVSRGHHITMYSPYPPQQNVTNFSHVFVENQAFLDVMASFDFFRDCQDMNWFFKDTIFNVQFNRQINEEILSDSEFRELLTSQETFDLVMVEPFFSQEASLLLGHHFKAPVISMGAVGPNTNLLDAMHSPNNPSFMPEIYSYMTDEMTFLQRIQNWHYSALLCIFRLVKNLNLDKMIAEKIGPGYPPIDSLLKNISFAFLYSNPGLEYARPLSPNMVQVGGIHMQGNKTQTLPEDLKKTLDSATESFILFSLGSVITPKTIPPHLSATLLQVFSKLKFKIIWKWSGEPLANLPPNVFQLKWVPQRVVLAHPNCKLFITHGGLSSQLETIHAGVPVVTIPFFGDQFSNAAKAVKFGFGEILKNTNLTSVSLEWAITTVTGNLRYKQRALEMSKLSKDTPKSPLDTAVFWTEYVIQHRGATHLTPTSKDLYWFQYYLLDVIAFILAILLLAIFLLRVAWRKVVNSFREKKLKTKRE